jgi:hypothetical protein
MHFGGWAMPCDRRYSPTVRSCLELARIGRKRNRSSQCLSSSRYVDGIKVLAEQFNHSVLAMVRKAAERVSPAETLEHRRHRRAARAGDPERRSVRELHNSTLGVDPAEQRRQDGIRQDRGIAKVAPINPGG